MPKQLLCTDCKSYLGEMEKGRIKNGTVIRCAKCEETNQMIIMASKLSNVGNDSKYPKDDYGSDLFNNLFGGSYK